ncbi:MAG: pyridoxal-phosphate dependent enzyme, partial [Alcanivoracaceae bacterium]
MAADYRPLLNRFPQLRASLAPTPLCDLPTPVQHLSSLGGHAWVKRDDLTASEYGGNKMRKLEFILADMDRHKARHVVTLGATGTNAGVAAALACHNTGRSCDIFTFPQPDTDTVRKNRALMEHYGARCLPRRNLLSAALGWYLHPGRL